MKLPSRANWHCCNTSDGRNFTSECEGNMSTSVTLDLVSFIQIVALFSFQAEAAAKQESGIANYAINSKESTGSDKYSNSNSCENYRNHSFWSRVARKSFSNESFLRCDRFWQIFVQIGAILAIFGRLKISMQFEYLGLTSPLLVRKTEIYWPLGGRASPYE